MCLSRGKSLSTLLCFCALLLTFPMPVSGAKAKVKLANPGFRTIGYWNPATMTRMDIAVWYPSTRTPRALTLEGWQIQVGQNGSVIPGRYPVILLSHDTAASRLASHDLAAFLARNYFIVIAPTHPGDNTHDTQKTLQFENWQNRPQHLLLALEAVTASMLREFVDTKKIGLLGVGAGSISVLQLAGATPDLHDLGIYCAQASLLDPLCTAWAGQMHSQLEKDFSSWRAEREILYDTENLKAPTSLTEKAQNNIGGAGSLPEKSFTAASSPQWQFKAVGLLTPAYLNLFAPESIKKLELPTGVVLAAKDDIFNSEKVTAWLNANLTQEAKIKKIKRANRADLQAPCPPMYTESFSALCTGSETENNYRSQTNSFFVHFFQKELNSL